MRLHKAETSLCAGSYENLLLKAAKLQQAPADFRAVNIMYALVSLNAITCCCKQGTCASAGRPDREVCVCAQQ